MPSNKVMNKYRDIVHGRAKDDFSNHFLSHFGFYPQEHRDEDMSCYNAGSLPCVKRNGKRW